MHDEEDRIGGILSHVEELRKPSPWYQRSPFKEMLTHAVTVIVALSLGWTIHELTGAPMPAIEAKNEKPAFVPPSPMVSAPSIGAPATTSLAFADTVAEEMQADEVVECVEAKQAAKKKAAKASRPPTPALAPAAAAPAAPPPPSVLR